MAITINAGTTIGPGLTISALGSSGGGGGGGGETIISNAWGPNDGVWYNTSGNQVLFFQSSTTEELNTALASFVPGTVFKATTKESEFFPGTVVQEVTFTVVTIDPGNEFEPVWAITVTSSVSIGADAELDGVIGITIIG